MAVTAGVFPINVYTFRSILVAGQDSEEEYGDIPTPSKPSWFTIVATFFAYWLREVSSFAAVENPELSPHPPIAIMSLVPGLKRLRMVETDSKGVNCGGELELKSVDWAKAMIACVMP